jgi:gamma-glutamylcyclotransferase (GGCT)/AIG2-like uncharacterized protein YtfP
MSKSKRRLYIAYGSNLNLEQMTRRCPTAMVVGTAVMRNWRLLFRGASGGAVATVERFRGGQVPVLVWELQPSDEAALDRYEGYPHLYRKETVRIKLNERLVSAMIYIMNDGYPLGQPSACYFNVIQDGYNSAGFDSSILLDAAQKSNEKGGASMDSTIKEQILAVRDTGETNMFDVNTVMRIAIRDDFYELADYLLEHVSEYCQFILTGKAK